MPDKEPFEDRLNRWTLNELKIERTRTNFYSKPKLGRINTRIAELEFGSGATRAQDLSSELYVSQVRLDSLRSLRSPQFDLQRLVRLCEEINSSWRHNNLIAVAVLTRVLIDHVPPIFAHDNFAQVVGSASRSAKSVFESLEQRSRKISDALIHQTIRKKETLPTRQMVNFSQNLDVLLAEAIRTIEESNA